jgi:LytR cell envelope-related transcriptional attenuator
MGAIGEETDPVASVAYTVYGISRRRRIARAVALFAGVLAVLFTASTLVRALVPDGSADSGAPARAKQERLPRARGGEARPLSVPKPLPPPASTPLMVLNANGTSGVATSLAAQLRSRGYPTPTVADAGRRGLPTMIMYRPGWGRSAQALARAVPGVSYVSPLDGMRTSDLGSAVLVVILGK